MFTDTMPGKMFSVAGEIGRIEEAWQVPVDRIAHVEHQSEQLLRALVTVVLQVHQRAIGVDRLARTLDDLGLHALHVHLEEMAGGKVKAVEREQWTRFAPADIAHRDPTKIGANRGDQRRHHEVVAGSAPTAACQRVNVRALVERQIGTQRLEHDALRLERVNFAVGADRGATARPCAHRCWRRPRPQYGRHPRRAGNSILLSRPRIRRISAGSRRRRCRAGCRPSDRSCRSSIR